MNHQNKQVPPRIQQLFRKYTRSENKEEVCASRAIGMYTYYCNKGGIKCDECQKKNKSGYSTLFCPTKKIAIEKDTDIEEITEKPELRKPTLVKSDKKEIV